MQQHFVQQLFVQQLFSHTCVIDTDDRGRGVICLTDVAEQTIVTEYVGDFIDNEEVKRRKEMRDHKDYYLFKVNDDLFIDAAFAGSVSRYINHSCEPNCISEKIKVEGITRIAIISNQPIKAVSYMIISSTFKIVQQLFLGN